jgi:hypothetical protein
MTCDNKRKAFVARMGEWWDAYLGDVGTMFLSFLGTVRWVEST